MLSQEWRPKGLSLHPSHLLVLLRMPWCLTTSRRKDCPSIVWGVQLRPHPQQQRQQHRYVCRLQYQTLERQE